MARHIVFPQPVIPTDKVYFCQDCGFIGFFEKPPEKHFDPSIPQVWPCEGELIPSTLVRRGSILGKIRDERTRQLRKWSRSEDSTKTPGKWFDLIQSQLSAAKKSHRRKHLVQAAALIVAMIETLGPEDIEAEDPF